MSRAHAEELFGKLEKAMEWPFPKERNILREIALYAALRDSDDDYLKPDDWGEDREWILDPLAQRIPQVWADLIYGEDPVFEHPDQNQLDALVEHNDLVSELQSQMEMTSSEGESWWRVHVDEDISEYPILSWHSRSVVLPYFKGRRLVAVAFISVIQEGNYAWRFVECHSDGIVINRLFKLPANASPSDESGRANLPKATTPGKAFGDEVPLTDRPETEDVMEEWEHGLDHMLCGRIPNRRPRKPSLPGISDFQGKVKLILALSDAVTVGHENMWLTAKKRAVVDQEVLTPQVVTAANGVQMTLPAPEFDKREGVFVRQALDQTLGGDSDRPFQILEYSFDAAALETYIDGTTNRILTRCRIAPQLVGRDTEGAQTGPALRARLMDSVLAAHGKGRFQDEGVPEATRALMLVDNLPRAKQGFGRSYSKIDEKVSMERTDALPVDEEVETRVDTMRLDARTISRKTVIEKEHPDWDADRVTKELKQIDEDAEPPDFGDGTTPEPPPPPGGVREQL